MIEEKDIPAIIKLLDDPDENIYSQIKAEIINHGQSIVAHLESAWEKSFDFLVQQRIENLVHQIQFNVVHNDLMLWHQSGDFDLLRGILIINKYQYPDLDEQKIINQIENIKREVWLQLMYDISEIENVKILNHIFFNQFGFSGNTTNHHDPSNSFISHVLESKKGNQISLSIIYSIVAQKLDIPIYGVNLPQHFVLAYIDESKQSNNENGVLFYINPFNKGHVFAKRDIDQFLRQLNIDSSPHFYEPCNNAEIIKRVLRNLISSYENQGLKEKVEEIKILLSVFTAS